MLTSLLFGGGAFPFVPLAGAALVIALVAVVASVVPVTRAIRLNPSEVPRTT